MSVHNLFKIEDIIEHQKQSLEKDIELLKKHIETIDSSIKEYSKYDIIYEIANKELRDAKQGENNFAIKTAEVNK